MKMIKPKCYGKRIEAYPKCEDCDFIVECSIKTLKDYWGQRIEVIGP